MNKQEEMRKSIRNMQGKQPVMVFWAVVKSVNEQSETCVIIATQNNLEYEEVLLSIKQTGTVEIPEVNSNVLCGIIENKQTDVFVLKVEKIEKIIIRNSGDYSIEIAGKFEFKNTITDLKTVISDLIKAVKAITVPTGVGPSGVPINLPQFVAVEQKLNALMK